MRALSEFSTVYLYPDAGDFRKSINGLSIIVEQDMNLSPYDSALFVFLQQKPRQTESFFWAKTGFCLWYKRLEQDKFQWPKKSLDKVIVLSSEQMNWLLRGFDIAKLQSYTPQKYGALT